MPEPHCDLSSAFVLSAADSFAPKAANSTNSTDAALWRVLLRSAAADVTCSERASEAECEAEAVCSWDGDSAPSCGIDPAVTASAMSGASLCPGSLMAKIFPCTLAATEDACKATRDCRWSAIDEKAQQQRQLMPEKGADATGVCNHKDWLKKLDGPDKGAALQDKLANYDPDVWGDCAAVKALLRVLNSTESCIRAVTKPACAARGPLCRWDAKRANATGDDAACTPTRTATLAGAGAQLNGTLLSAAGACAGATRPDTCWAAGGAVKIDEDSVHDQARVILPVGSGAAPRLERAGRAAAAAVAGAAALLVLLA
ncbi:hypothetical protein Rsub_09917 [Raphidocelis subcapitata]|uniref:Uncharacterized protein n=1 Tax=Raphidocelis subcapitata TaxID=307507 RepID=A0A2V0PD75_9CHLO|nr:hypothetical protein Rsub_09917 [Raphidocelis subcapitata]|eukprot:GBF96912.1 hypothetical protein Rsub_09917 [Raphidocelis subcapitata]